MATAWLFVVSKESGLAEPVSLLIRVDLAWLLAQVERDGNHATLVLSTKKWISFSLLNTPILTLLGLSFNVSLRQVNGNQPNLDFYVNVSGTIEQISDLQGQPQYRLAVRMGTVTLFARNGITSHQGGGNSLLDPVPSGASWVAWRNQAWPQPGVDIERIAFGADAVQLDVIRTATSERRRVELASTEESDRVWRLCDCDSTAGFQSADDIVAAIHARLQNHFLSFPNPRPVRVSRRGAVATRSAVLFRAERTTNPNANSLKQVVRPDFQLTFQDAEMAGIWTPRSIEEIAGDAILSDAAVEESLRGVSHPAPNFFLQWNRTAGAWSCTDAQIPTVHCLGADTVPLQQNFLWQFTTVNPTPARAEFSAPVWVRYEFQEPERPVETHTRGAALPLVIPFAASLVPDGWPLQLTLDQRSRAAADETESTQRFRVIVRDLAKTRLESSNPHVRVASTPILAYQLALLSPASPPNSQRLDGAQVHGDRDDPLAETRLVFETVNGGTSRPSLLATLTASRWRLTSQAQGFRAYLPYHAVACIDQISASAGNLRQSIDVTTGRAVVERDTSHGLTPWTNVNAFRIEATPMPGVVRFDSTAGFVPLADKVAAAMALSPWVECRDSLTAAATLRRLHHGNLVLEHGDFSAASGDRATQDATDAGSGANALAANRVDFLEAARDAYSLAVADLPSTQAAAAPVRHWLPGAQLVDESRNPVAEPAAWLEAPQGTTLADRLPTVRRRGSTELLRPILFDPSAPPVGPQHWLDFDVWWNGWTGTGAGRRPIVEVTPATNSPRVGTVRTRNANVPLLFEGAPMSAGASAEDRCATGNARGLVQVTDAVNGQLLFEHSLTRIVRGIAIARTDMTRIFALDGGGVCRQILESDMGEFVTSDVPLPAMSTKGAAALIVDDDNVLITQWNDTAFRAMGWVAGAAQSIVVPPIPFSSSEIEDVQILLAGNDVVLAVALRSHPPMLMRGVFAAGQWTLTAMSWVTSPPAQSWQAALAELTADPETDPDVGAVFLAVVVDARRSFEIWRRASDLTFEKLHQVRWLRPDGTTHELDRIALGEDRSGASEAVEDARFVFVTERDGAVVSTRFPRTGPADVAILRPHRTFGPVADIGQNDRDLAKILSPSLLGDRLRLLLGGDAGKASLWDADGGFELVDFPFRHLSLDALGTVRQSRFTFDAAGVRCREVSFPGSPSALRGDAASAHPAEKTAISMTRWKDQADETLLISGGSVGHETEIRFECEDLLLEESSGVWKPIAFAADTPPDEDRPELAFPWYRGRLGMWRLFSESNGETHSLNGAIRLAGLPCVAVSLDEIQFEDAADHSGLSFDRIKELTFTATLVNPIDVSGELASPGDPSAHAPAAEKGLASGNLLTVTLKRDGSAFKIDAVVAKNGVLRWGVATDIAPEADEVSGRFVRLAVDVEWTMVSTDDYRMVVKPRPSECFVQVLDALLPLDAPLGEMVGFGRLRGRFGLRWNVGQFANFQNHVLAWADRAAKVAIPEGDEFGAMAIAAPVDSAAELAWLDRASGRPWSRSSLSGAVVSLEAASVPIASVVFSDGPKVFLQDGGNRIVPGLPIPGLRDSFSSNAEFLLHDEQVSALAMDVDHNTPWLAIGDRFGGLALRDLRNGRQVLSLSLGGTPVETLALCGVRNHVIVAAALRGATRLTVIRLLDGRIQDTQTFSFALAENGRKRLLRLGSFGDVVQFACVSNLGGSRSADWQFLDVSVPNAVWTPRGFLGDAPAEDVTALAFGRHDDDHMLYYARGGLGHVVRTNDGVTTTLVGVGTAPVIALGFFDSGVTHVLAAVARERIQRWTQSFASGSWGTWASDDVTLPTGAATISAQVFAAHARLAAIVDTNPTSIALVDVTSTPSIRTVPDALPTNPFCGGLIPVPHAILQTDDVHDLTVVDLRNALPRGPLALTAAAQQVIAVSNEHATFALAAVDNDLYAWDIVTGEAIEGSPFDFGESLLLASHGGQCAAVGASRAVVFSPRLDVPLDDAIASGTSIALPGDEVTALALSDQWLAIAADGRIDVWWFTALASPRTVGSLTDRVTVLRRMVTPFGETLVEALAFNAAGGIVVWALAAANDPIPLWRFNDPTTDPGSVARVSADGALVVCRSLRAREWRPQGIWSVDNVDGCIADAAAPLPGNTPDDESLSTFVTQTATGPFTTGSSLFRLHREDGRIDRLLPISRDRGVFGFVGDQEAPGARSGHAIFGLSGVPNGLAWTRLTETVERSTMKLQAKRPDGSDLPVPIDCTADVVRLDAVSVFPDGSVRSSAVAAARISASTPSPLQLTLHLGEHVRGSDQATPIMALAHLESQWQLGAAPNVVGVILQGPVAVEVDWDAAPATIRLIPGIFRMSASTRDSADQSAPQELGWPREGNSLDAIDLVGTKPLPPGLHAGSVGKIAITLGADPFFHDAPNGGGTGVAATAVVNGSFFRESGRIVVGANDYSFTAASKIGDLLETITHIDARFAVSLDDSTHEFTVTSKSVGAAHNGVVVQLRGNTIRGVLPTTAGGANAIEPSFVHGPFVQPARLQLHLVGDGEVPLDPCFDQDAIGSLGGQALEVPGLVHRLALGGRLKYSQRQSQLLSRPIPSSPIAWVPGSMPQVAIQWLLAPVLRAGHQFQIAKQSLVVDETISGAPSEHQTENLLSLSPASATAGGSIVGLLTTTRSAQNAGPLSEDVVQVALRGVNAAGLIVHRLIRKGDPAAFRIGLRKIEETAGIPAIIASGDGLAATDRDSISRFRTGLPGPSHRVHIPEHGHYWPVPSSSPDLNELPVRELRHCDVARSDEPLSALGASLPAVFLSERTLFHNFAPRRGCPNGADFALTNQSGGGWFHPATLKVLYAPDKPGAVAYLGCQGIEKRPDATIGRAPLADVALREPMQLDPPKSSELKFVGIPDRERRSDRGLDRITVQWEETLGRLRLANSTDSAVPLEQVLPAPTTAADLRVRFAPRDDEPFVQCFLRVHDELLELDASEGRFPAYDASQQARTPRDLVAADLIGDPFATTLPTSPDSLTASRSSRGALLLLTSPRTSSDRARLEVRSAEDSSLLRSINATAAATTISGAIAPLANASTGADDSFVLTNDNGTVPGLYDIPLTSAAATPRLFGGVMPANVLAVAAGARSFAVNDETISASFKAALQQTGGNARVLLWWTAAPRQSGEAELTLDFGVFTCEPRLQCAMFLTESPTAVRLTILCAVASAVRGPGAKILTRCVQIEVPRTPGSPIPATTATSISTFDVPHRSAWTVIATPTTDGERPRLFSGAVDGAVTDQDAVNGTGSRRFRHAGEPVQISAGESPLGRLLLVVHRASTTTRLLATTIWNADTATPLRRIRPASQVDVQYSIVIALARKQGIAVVAATVPPPSSSPDLRMFDLRTSVVVPPEIFLTSRIPSLLEDVDVPCKLEDGTDVELTLTPQLVLQDRNDRDVLYLSNLKAIFRNLGVFAGVTVWRFDPENAAQSDVVDLRWPDASHLRLTWRTTSGDLIETSLFEPTDRKLVALQPFSATAARIALVAFADRQSPRAPLFERTILFGDAASSEKSNPDVQSGRDGLEFRISVQERQTIDVPVPESSALDLMLLKYLPLGQVLCCGNKDIPYRSPVFGIATEGNEVE